MPFPWIPGTSRITFTKHEQSLRIRRRDGKIQSLSDLCKDVTPPCGLNPFLFNGHLQTLWTVLKSPDIPIYYKRAIFEAEEPEYAGTFAVDFAVPPYKEKDPTLPPRTTYFADGDLTALGSDDAKPMLIVLHGLSGGSHEDYLRCCLEPLIAAGWEACVVNSRGCALSRVTSPILYNARATWDVRQVVKWARKTWPSRKLFGLGFSLGANILTNYLGEEGATCLFEAAVVCSNPWNLDTGSIALQRTWLGLNVYSRAMGSSLRKLFECHADELSKNPRVDVEKVRNTVFLHEFDRELQCPTWGYPKCEGAYYRDASSCDALNAVRIPLLALNARDDPIVSKDALPVLEFEQNPYTVLCTTALGGHLGWFEFSGKRWFAKPVSQFLTKIAEGIDIDQPPFKAQNKALDGVSIGVSPPPYIPTRRKLRMAIDVD